MKIPEVFKIEVTNSARNLSQLISFFADNNLNIAGMHTLTKYQKSTLWELTVEIAEEEIEDILQKVDTLQCAKVIGRSDRVFVRHEGGKIKTISTSPIASRQELRDIYTPGVARVCLAIQSKPELAKKYTAINNTVAIVTNGTAILGLGDIGAVAGMPVMEGKAALFSHLVGISGVPILIESKSIDKIIDSVEAIAPSFGAIQLEDIAAPDCFIIEQELQKRLNIPVVHDDQHGTAVVALAALLSASKLIGKSLKSATIGQVGLGAAGIGIARLLLAFGAENIVGTDLNEDALQRLESLGGKRAKGLKELVTTSDIIIATTGVKDLIKPEWIQKGQLILALTNPEPEILPVVALEHGAAFAADGKAVNNVLGFPGIFKGAMQAGVSKVTDSMLIAAAQCIHLNTPKGRLVPDPLDKNIHAQVTDAVVEAALKS